MARPKRKDKTRTVLRTGELQRSDGSISTVGLMKTIKEDMSIQKRLKHSGLKRKRLRKTKVMA